MESKGSIPSNEDEVCPSRWSLFDFLECSNQLAIFSPWLWSIITTASNRASRPFTKIWFRIGLQQSSLCPCTFTEKEVYCIPSPCYRLVATFYEGPNKVLSSCCCVEYLCLEGSIFEISDHRNPLLYLLLVHPTVHSCLHLLHSSPFSTRTFLPWTRHDNSEVDHSLLSNLFDYSSPPSPLLFLPSHLFGFSSPCIHLLFKYHQL